MIFYINPLVTTKNTYRTHTHKKRHRNQNLSIPRGKKKETQRKTAREERGTK